MIKWKASDSWGSKGSGSAEDTKHMQKREGGGEPHKTLRAFEDRVYKVTGFEEKAELQVWHTLLSGRIYAGALSKYG